ncbi:MAG TPA: VCBS repeat-containing protein [Pyrinomonadaceae bacterium]|nr:VCBS repeat-containing protein [Pyrinomonadaceae bacterium]
MRLLRTPSAFHTQAKIYTTCGLIFILALGCLAGRQAQAQQQPAKARTPAPERTRLEVIEDLSESLANDLLELSVATRDRDLERTAQFFPAKLNSSPYPARALPLKDSVKWVKMHDWIADAPDAVTITRNGTLPPFKTVIPGSEVAKTPRAMTREEFMRGWVEFLAHFSEIEDARFKVKEANFDEGAQAVAGAKEPTAVVGATGKARVAFYVIGRDTEGRREWARGVANVQVRYDASNRWQFDTFSLASLDSMVATSDLFSEVAIPAGVGASLPAFGSAGNGGFVWHGAAASDFNRDGLIDLFVTAPARNFLYLNDGTGRFKDASDAAGVKLLATGVAPLVFDYDNDGDGDVFVSNVGAQVLFENRLVPDGKLEFRDVSQESGVGGVTAIGFSAVAGDVNNDGRQDIYITSYNRYGQITPDSWFRATNGTPNLLLINQPDGTFKEEAKRWGVDDSRWSYAAAFADVNADGRIDLYVANDFGEKAMFINQGDKFTDEAKERGVLDPGNGMGVSFGDYNNDGLLDVHASNMSSTAGNRILARLFPNQSAKDNVLKKLAAGNNLFENQGGGKFRDVTSEVGGFGGGWAWGGGFIDFDNDGWEDIYTPNGFISGKSMKDT